MSSANYPKKYLQLNAQTSKTLSLILEIEGIPYLFGIAASYTKLRYGDFGLVFGAPGEQYGGLRLMNNVKPYIILDQGLTISQRIEPEQGKGNIGTISVALIDKNGEVAEIVSPGITVDEIMASKQCRLWLGFTQSSYPEDYLLLYRGYITSIQCPPGKVVLQISDCTMKVRQPVFQTSTSTTLLPQDLNAPLAVVANVGGFYSHILGPDGTYDSTFKTYVKVSDEYQEYSSDGLSANYSTVRATPLSGVTGHSTNVSSIMAAYSPSTSRSTPGALVGSDNYVVITDSGGGFIDDGASPDKHNIYGRLTYATGVWTLSYFVNINGVETPYSFPSPFTLFWYFNVVGALPSGVTAYGQPVFTLRGGSHSFGTVQAENGIQSDVSAAIQLGGNAAGINCIDAALKVLLSGWDGPCNTGISVLSFNYTYNINTPRLYSPSAFLLKDKDAFLDLGLTVGDYFYITGASVPGNNLSGRITGFEALNDRTTIIYTDQIFSVENPSAAQVAFRSQYDTFPVKAGVGCRTQDVDVDTYQKIKASYFTASAQSNVRITYSASTDGKDAIEKDLLLPFGCYGVSRYGRISMAITKPPMPGQNTKLVELNYTNIIEPEKISVGRALNSRSFFNLITYKFDYDLTNDNFGNIQQFLDSDSVTHFDFVQELPIEAKALSSTLGGATIAQQRGKALLTRYKKCAVMLDLRVNWSVGSLLEVSDIVVLRDEGNLKIMNFETGKRDLGVQLFEVIDRQYNIAQGTVTLKLLGGLGFNLDARFGLIAPSSQLNSGSTTSTLRLQPSYGQTTISGEMSKWSKLMGSRVRVHSWDYTFNQLTTLVQANATDPSAIDVNPPLSMAPPQGYIIDIVEYPSDTNQTEDSLLKLLYSHFSPQVKVATGISKTQFTVSSGDIGKFTAGNTVILHNFDYSVASDEVKIASISGTTVTLATAIGFVPDSTYYVDGIGFHDGTSFYRYG